MEQTDVRDGQARFAARESVRRQQFDGVWNNELHAVFRDVAPYYDIASNFASLGLYKRWYRRFVASIDIRPGHRVLDLCAGTNAIGRALLQKEPRATVCAMDRSAAMQEVGQKAARAIGFEIESMIGDVHRLPFPDGSFDIVTLAFASRHLRIVDVVAEARRVLKPGGMFHHCDMLRPRNPIIERAYYFYLRACLTFTALSFRSCPEAWRCRSYFVDAIERFYSAEEFSELLSEAGYDAVSHRKLVGGVVDFHGARKP